MIAKIKIKDNVYDSVVFAVSYKSFKCKAVVFDESYSKLIVVNYSWNSETNVMFINYDCDSFKINNENFKVYWNNKNIFDIVAKQKYSIEMLEEAKALQEKVRSKEWYEINDIFDLEGLIFSVGNFHDACVIKIEEKENYTEILIDTTWGYYVLMKCYGVIENSLDLNYYFFHCNYSYEDGIIEINFYDEFSGLEKLKCEKICYKYFFEKACKVKTIDVNIDSFIFNSNLKSQTEIKINEIDKQIFSSCDSQNIGMKMFFDDLGTYTFPYNDYFIVVKFNQKKNESADHFKSRFNELGNQLNKKGLNFYYIDQEYFWSNGYEDFGHVEYQEEYKDFKGFYYLTKFAGIPLLGNIIFWLILQLFNPQMKWIIFWIFGIGISFITLLIYLITYVVNYKGTKNILILYEEGIVCSGNIVNCSIAYDAILDVQKGKRIVITTNFSKIKLIKSANNDYIYKMILSKIKADTKF